VSTAAPQLMGGAPLHLVDANTPRVGVLAVQGGVGEHLSALAVAGVDPVPVRRPVELAAVAGLVIPGGESTTIGRLLEVFDLLTPLRAALSAGLPVYGSCAGMILLAREILDGRAGQPQLAALDITVRRNAFGRQVASAEADLAFADIRDPGRPMHAVFIRAPWVERVGPGVEVLARVSAPPTVAGLDAGGRPAPASAATVTERVVAVRSGAVLATAFHPELTGDTRVHELFVSMVRAAGSPGA